MYVIKCINKKNNKKKLTFKFKNIKYIKKKDKVQWKILPKAIKRLKLNSNKIKKKTKIKVKIHKKKIKK